MFGYIALSIQKKIARNNTRGPSHNNFCLNIEVIIEEAKEADSFKNTKKDPFLKGPFFYIHIKSLNSVTR